jgi:hypothetical protein
MEGYPLGFDSRALIVGTYKKRLKSMTDNNITFDPNCMPFESNIITFDPNLMTPRVNPGVEVSPMEPAIVNKIQVIDDFYSQDLIYGKRCFNIGDDVVQGLPPDDYLDFE